MKLLRAILYVALMFTTSLYGRPYVPADDGQVLERLPLNARDPLARELNALRARLAMQPGNLPLAVQLAGRYIETGRSSGDPRYAGYAEAVLRPWSVLSAPPREVLLLRALLRQRVHDFDAALNDLAGVLAIDPADVQARLTRATILTVRGDYPAARADCDALRGRAEETVWAVCATGVESMRGRLGESYELLSAVLARNDSAPTGVRVWALTALGEMAQRLGRPRETQEHLHAGLMLDADDQYLLSAYADVLLEHSRYREAAELVRPHLRNDGLLLRYAEALSALRDPQAAAAVADLRARYGAARRRGERVHLRDEARFALHLRHQPEEALAPARENWNVQKEPADLRIFALAALAARAEEDLEAVHAWVRATGFEDAVLARLLSSQRLP